MPKLLPPPFSAVKRSWCSVAFALMMALDARTISMLVRESQTQPFEAEKKDIPPADGVSSM